ncbi:hypothetical protein Pcinc_040676 [Petrolisthes cinctipes]|uniref:Uncharacterized protein n=1 Tax=Petrolisthes cinctipes TaxID=88211 RepID=A0AAE1EIF3_PETCI|nr:hypothetical protein Pcinc_040676 [Petrolisthes cinctipes]
MEAGSVVVGLVGEGGTRTRSFLKVVEKWGKHSRNLHALTDQIKAMERCEREIVNVPQETLEEVKVTIESKILTELQNLSNCLASMEEQQTAMTTYASQVAKTCHNQLIKKDKKKKKESQKHNNTSPQQQQQHHLLQQHQQQQHHLLQQQQQQHLHLHSLMPLHSVCLLMTQIIALKRWPLNQARVGEVATFYALSKKSSSSSLLETELERLASVLEKES